MNYKFILALDPSGSYNEGKGTTGWCILNAQDMTITKSHYIQAAGRPCAEHYWDAHLALIQKYADKYGDNFVVVIEDYLLYANKAMSQTNSHFETSRLIGLLQWYCWKNQIPLEFQTASQVKVRWNDEILVFKKFIKKKGNGYTLPDGTELNRHCKDAIRHAAHFATFNNNGGSK